jgi:hypothetical protein
MYFGAEEHTKYLLSEAGFHIGLLRSGSMGSRLLRISGVKQGLGEQAAKEIRSS